NESFLSKNLKQSIWKKQEEILYKTDMFYTISDRMKNFYFKNFSKNSKLLRNLTFNNHLLVKKETKDFLYAGNFYYGRDEMLAILAEAIKDLNNEFQQNFTLNLYSNSPLTDCLNKQVNENPYVSFFGKVSQEELIEIISQHRYVIFVESFIDKNIEKVKFSFSTKITELALQKKCIVSLAPIGIGSMDELQKFSFCINNLETVKERLYNLISSNYRIYEEKAYQYAKKYYNRTKQSKILENDILIQIEKYKENAK
ncbi:MAG: hypothetical protein RR623_05650, partial [Bacilli bacterium]